MRKYNITKNLFRAGCIDDNKLWFVSEQNACLFEYSFEKKETVFHTFLPNPCKVRQLIGTYASRCIENEILMYIRKSCNRRVEISMDEPLNTDWDGNELLLSDVLGTEDDVVYKNIEASEDSKIIAEAVSKLGKREQMIVKLRFGLYGEEEKTQKEVADMLGISQSYISRRRPSGGDARKLPLQ